MARIRSIHPGIFTDEAFMTASHEARLLIIGLWCEAHDDGVFEWKPLTLKVRLMPADSVDVGALLEELERLNFVRRFNARGKTFGAIRNFQRYQRPKKPNRSGVLPDDLLPYVRGDGTGSALVEEEFGTGGEPLHHGEEDGEEDGKGGGEEPGSRTIPREAAARSISASPVRKGTDELGPWLRSLVGSEPVLHDLRTEPIARLLDEGLTRSDVEAGIAAAMASPDFRPRSWTSLVGWVRTAAKERLAAAPKVSGHSPAGSAAPKPLPDVGKIRRGQISMAAEHFRGRWNGFWPNTMRPDHPDCVLAEDVIAEARAIVDTEKAAEGNPEAMAKLYGYVPSRPAATAH